MFIYGIDVYCNLCLLNTSDENNVKCVKSKLFIFKTINVVTKKGKSELDFLLEKNCLIGK